MSAEHPTTCARFGPAMRLRFILMSFVLATETAVLSGQDLAPRAYIITPVHSNAVTLTWSFYNGSLDFNGTIPVTGATGTYHIPVVSYYHSLSIFGRSANVTTSLPYGIGNFSGDVFGTQRSAYRSGLLDFNVRFSVNLIGGPAMPVEDFLKWKQKTLLGASLKVVAPTGQYNPAKPLNWGLNRWAFKPEIGYSQRWNHWVLDAYAAVWFFTENSEFFSHNQYFAGTRSKTQSPVTAFEAHLSYDVRPRLWVSLDANFWSGGETSVNGVPNLATYQRNSRVGVTASIPITARNSIKLSYNDGAYIRYGGNYRSISASWQYGWVGWPQFH